MRPVTASPPPTSKKAFSFLLAALAMGVIGWGWLEQTSVSPRLFFPILGGMSLWLIVEMYQGLKRYFLAEQPGERSYELWLGFGLALLACTMLTLRLSGGLYSPFYPVFYLLIAWLASIGTSPAGGFWFLYAFALEVAAVLASGPLRYETISLGALHLLWLALFAGSHHLFLMEIFWSIRRTRQMRRMAEERPRLSRLNADADAERFPIPSGGYETFDQERQAMLSFLREALDAHSCMVLWLRPDGQTYDVLAHETQDTEVGQGPFSNRTGTPASVFKNLTPQRVYSRTEASSIHLPYYDASLSIRAFVAAPIRQGSQIRGLLCADRTHNSPFTAREEAMLQAATVGLHHQMEEKRSSGRPERDIPLLQLLAEANQRLHQASSEREMADHVLQACLHLIPYDWAFVSKVTDDHRYHTLLSGSKELAPLVGKSLVLSHSLLALAFKHRRALPEGGILRSQGPYIAQADPEGLPPMNSLLLLPLIVEDRPFGCLALASRDPHRFSETGIERLLTAFASVAGPQLAYVQKAGDMDSMQEYDFLTEIYNHRTFMEKLQRSVLHARQQSSNLSLLLVSPDILGDINDRYGYATGDAVLRSLAHLIVDLVPENDIAARYSNATLAILLEGQDSLDALRLGDRLRRAFAETEIRSSSDPQERVELSLSIGIAAYPDQATEMASLCSYAEIALAEAKRSGGDEAILFSIPSTLSKTPPEPTLAVLSPTNLSSSHAPAKAAPPPSLVERLWGWGYRATPTTDPRDEAWTWLSSSPERPLEPPRDPASFSSVSFSPEQASPSRSSRPSLPPLQTPSPDEAKDKAPKPSPLPASPRDPLLD